MSFTICDLHTLQYSLTLSNNSNPRFGLLFGERSCCNTLCTCTVHTSDCYDNYPDGSTPQYLYLPPPLLRYYLFFRFFIFHHRSFFRFCFFSIISSETREVSILILIDVIIIWSNSIIFGSSTYWSSIINDCSVFFLAVQIPACRLLSIYQLHLLECWNPIESFSPLLLFRHTIVSNFHLIS